jgi:hypothetical protein
MDVERAHGFHGAWVSNARVWSATTRRLLNAPGAGEARLVVVALHQCLFCASLVVAGHPDDVTIPPDAAALADCPIATDELHRQCERVQAMRDEVLHLSKLTRAGRGIVSSWTRTPPYFVHKTSVNSKVDRSSGTFDQDEITLTDIEVLLDALDPWLQRHHHRWISEEQASDANGVEDDFVVECIDHDAATTVI